MKKLLFLTGLIVFGFFFAGEIKANTEILRPNGQGSETNLDWDYWCVYKYGKAHWECVADVSPDGWGTCVGSDAATDYRRDLYALQNHSKGSGVINKVTIFITFEGNKPGNTSYYKPSLRTYGESYNGTEISEGISGEWLTRGQEWVRNPKTVSNWTWEEIDLLEVGVSVKKGSRTGAVTQVYAEIDYTPPLPCQDHNVSGWAWSNMDIPVPSPTGNLFENPGFETGNTTGWVITGTADVRTYSPISGTYSVGYGTDGYAIQQDEDVSAYSAEIDAGKKSVEVYIWSKNGGVSEGDKARIRIQYLNSSGGIIAEYDTGPFAVAAAIKYRDARTIPSGTRKIRLWAQGTEGGTSYNADVYYDDAYLSLTTLVPDESSIGWISFSCKNPEAPAPYDYGVDINSNGNFSGYAWSEKIGWINFAPAGPYPVSPNYSACLDLPGSEQACNKAGDYTISGWARALSYGGGWDGWIKLNGVSIDKTTGDFSGYAWSDMVIGWINFKGTNYKVKTSFSLNQPPDKPTKAQETTWDNCVFAGKSIPTFYWTYKDPESNPQVAYEIQVAENSSFSGKIFNHLVNSEATSYALDLTQDDENPDDLPETMQDYQLDFGKVPYHWRVKVKDDHNNWSEWSSPQQFQTPQEAYPYSGFDWEPEEPVQKEVVIFTPDDFDSSYLYTWIVTQGKAVYTDDTGENSPNPHIKFETSANKIKLQVAKGSYTCESQEYAITALPPLPEYKEIPPMIWLKKALTGLIAFIF